MNYPEIFRQAWAITTQHRYLRTLGTIASLFAILVGCLRIRYILPQPIGTGMDVWIFLQQNTDSPILYAILLLLGLGLMYALTFIFGVISEGGMISAITKIYDHNAELNISKTISFGIQSFLSLTEYRVLTNVFQISHFIIYILLVRFYLRIYLPQSTILQELTPFLIVLGIIITLATILLNYAEYHLIIHKAQVIDSIKKSATLVLFHFQETLLITLLIVLMTIRSLITMLLIFALPAIAIYIITFTKILLPENIALAVALTFVILLFIWSVMISGTLMVFTNAVWTISFLELEKKKEHKILLSEPDDI